MEFCAIRQPMGLNAYALSVTIGVNDAKTLRNVCNSLTAGKSGGNCD
jgi:hypothetical protein